MQKTHLEVVFYFDFKDGARFTVQAGNISACRRSLFEAFCVVLEHESIGMAKYDWLKKDTRSKGLWKKL